MPRSRFSFNEIHDLYLIDHAGGIPGDPAMWAYTFKFENLVREFNRHFRTDCTRNEVHDHYVRGLEKKRYRRNNEEVKLTKFSRSNYGPPPKVGVVEHSRLCRAYRREGIPLDRMAYTAAFDRICSEVPRLSKRGCWHYMLSRRKKKNGLPCLVKNR